MSREAVELQLVNYYAREGYYYHLQVTRQQLTQERRQGDMGGGRERNTDAIVDSCYNPSRDSGSQGGRARAERDRQESKREREKERER